MPCAICGRVTPLEQLWVLPTDLEPRKVCAACIERMGLQPPPAAGAELEHGRD